MREIKFRAWDDEAKRMYSPEDLEQPEIMDDTKKSIYSYLSFGALYIYDFRSEDPVEFLPLQATGWFDRNQKEIYEGDIVKLDGDIHQILWSEEIAGFVIMSKDGSAMMGGDYLGDVIEVIGNVYENPDLLDSRS